MSSAGPQLKPEVLGELSSRDPLQHLLHALNQPLTGLQCSLELAAAGPRRADQYIQTLREGLALTSRMRDLVNAMREIVDLQSHRRQKTCLCQLDQLVRETAADLLPVAEQKKVRVCTKADAALPVVGERAHLEGLMFRLLESAVTLARKGSDLHVKAVVEQDWARVDVSWDDQPLPERSPMSRAEMSLLIAETGWRQAAAEWVRSRIEGAQTCTIRMCLAPEPSTCQEERSK